MDKKLLTLKLLNHVIQMIRIFVESIVMGHKK